MPDLLCETVPDNDICSACFPSRETVVRAVVRSDAEASHRVTHLVSVGSSPRVCLGHDSAYYICHQAGDDSA